MKRCDHSVALAVILCLFMWSCGDDDSKPSPTPTIPGDVPDAVRSPDGGISDDGTTFAPYEGLDTPARARRLNDAGYASSVVTLRAHTDGTSWLLWSEPDSSFSRRLDQFDEDGRYIRSMDLAMAPDSFILDAAGRPIVWSNFCGPDKRRICIAGDGRDPAELPLAPRMRPVYELEWSGTPVKRTVVESEPGVSSMAASGDGTYVLLSRDGYELRRLTGDFSEAWKRPLMPALQYPAHPLDAVPPDQLSDDQAKELWDRDRRGRKLIRLQATELVTVQDGTVVVAFAASGGAIAAVNAENGLSLPLPSEPDCSDVVVTHASAEGSLQYWVIPTPVCEGLPHLAVVGQHAVVASWLSVPKEPEWNDTRQSDIGLSYLDMVTGATFSRVIAFHEDDIPYDIAPCGERVCIAGTTGAKSVDTGSIVTYGDGFILPVGLDGEFGTLTRLTSPRHSEVLALATGRRSVFFYATVDGPITHTADNDPSLKYSYALLGSMPLP